MGFWEIPSYRHGVRARGIIMVSFIFGTRFDWANILTPIFSGNLRCKGTWFEVGARPLDSILENITDGRFKECFR
jgi:hypothetical protein